jgi:hypothetical protein
MDVLAVVVLALVLSLPFFAFFANFAVNFRPVRAQRG